MNIDYPSQQTISKLRREKLSAGIPFMINTDLLLPHQCFLEYPDGTLKIVEADRAKCDFRIIFEFSIKDSIRWKKKLKVT